MDKNKAASSLNCCLSLHKNDSFYEVEENEDIKTKSRKNTGTDK